MTLSRYEVLSKVVELESLTKAATALNLTQPGISHAINSLESEWGISLLKRGRGGVQVTNEGKRMMKHIQELLQINEKIKQETAAIKGLEIGEVRIGAFASVVSQWLPEIIRNFQKDYPAIDIHLHEGVYQNIEQWIINGAVDCGFVTIPTIYDSLNVTPLGKDRLLCIISDKHPLRNQNNIRFHQIEKEPFIMPSKGGDADVTRIFKKYHVTPSIKFKLVENQAIISMVENNLGISILAEMVLKGISNNIRILSLEQDCYRSIGIATNGNMSPATEKFISYVQAWINEQTTLDHLV